MIPGFKRVAMATAVVSYPAFSPADYAWIQSVRREHDPLYFRLIDPHFPLIFPTEALEKSILVEHVRSCAGGVPAFDVVFRCALLGDPDFQEHAHAFLVPDEGFSDIVRLHDRLYTGPLAGELRLDLPFLPHVGIANAPTPAACKAIVDRLNAKPFEIRARVAQLYIIGFDGEEVWEIERLPLLSQEKSD